MGVYMTMMFPFRIMDFKLPYGYKVPYSDSPIEANMKPRAVKCTHCHYEVISDLLAPKCGECNHSMITIIPRTNEQLATGNSKTA